jgi:hypothetical protein
MAEDIKVVITAEDKASGVFKNLTGSLSGLGSVLGKVAGIAGAGLVAAFGGLTAVAVSSVKAFDEQDRAIKQLEAVLTSTKQAAGLTKDELLDMATAFQKTTTYADETVLAAENVLLTFTNIKGSTVKDATQAVLDISIALGQDLKSSAIQVGKALQDPITGVTALRRVGVMLTEQQEDMIKKMMAAGDVMGAQKVILQELSTEFGGSAVKATETFSGKMAMLKNAVGELQETVGGALVEAITPFITQLTDWAQKPEVQQKLAEIVEGFAKLVKQIAPIIAEVLPNLLKVLGFIVSVFTALWDILMKVAEGFGTVIFKISQFIDWVKEAIKWVSDLISKLAELAKKTGGKVIESWKNVGSNISWALGMEEYAKGGVVAGPIGAPVPAIVHGGETVIPVGGRLPNTGFTINISGNTFLDDEAPRKMADSIINALKLELKI